MPAPTLVAGAPCWIDLYSSDTDKATAFYGALLGWTPVPGPPEFGGYFTFQKDGKTVAGCMRNDGEQGYPDAWTVHLLTEDAEHTAEAVRKHGGTVDHGPMEVASNGISTIITDPGGAAVGVWQPIDITGFEIRNEVGSAAWFELHTRDYDRTVAFYADALGWDAHTMSDTEDFRYTTLGEGEGSLAGIIDASSFLEADERASWTIYFEVEDADAALEQIVELGGTVVQEAEDTPWGRLAKAKDPTGTPFKLLAAN